MQIHQLLQECKRHSRSAQKTLYHSFATRMFLLCRRYMKTDEEAEEVMMNGFLKFFQTLHRFEYVNEASTVAWLKKKGAMLAFFDDQVFGAHSHDLSGCLHQ